MQLAEVEAKGSNSNASSVLCELETNSFFRDSPMLSVAVPLHDVSSNDTSEFADSSWEVLSLNTALFKLIMAG